MKPPMKNYWNCRICTEAAGGKLPKNHICTVMLGKCPLCKLKSTLIPYVDFDWPKNPKADRHAKYNRD